MTTKGQALITNFSVAVREHELLGSKRPEEQASVELRFTRTSHALFAYVENLESSLKTKTRRRAYQATWQRGYRKRQKSKP